MPGVRDNLLEWDSHLVLKHLLQHKKVHRRECGPASLPRANSPAQESHTRIVLSTVLKHFFSKAVVLGCGCVLESLGGALKNANLGSILVKSESLDMGPWHLCFFRAPLAALL